MGSNDGFKAIHAGGVDGDFVIPLNKRFKHRVWNQDFPRLIFFECVEAAKDREGVKFLEKVSFWVIGSYFL